MRLGSASIWFCFRSTATRLDFTCIWLGFGSVAFGLDFDLSWSGYGLRPASRRFGCGSFDLNFVLDRFAWDLLRFGFDPVGFWFDFLWDSCRVGAVCASFRSIRVRSLVVVESDWLGLLCASFWPVLQALPLGLDSVGAQVGYV